MEGDEGRVEEREREDGWNILKISRFHEPSPLLYSPLSLLPPLSQTYPLATKGCGTLRIVELAFLFAVI